MARSHHNTKKRTFTHLTEFDRGQIQALRKQGKTLQAIADEIGCHISTISRELKRGSVTQRRSDLTEYQAYFAEVGQRIYESNRSRCGAKYKLVQASEFIQYAVEKIQKDHWSPDAVCGYAKTQKLFDGRDMVCTKTLYRYIELGLLPVKNLDLPSKVSRNTKKKRVRQHKKVLGTSIEQRPAHIDKREEFGHWEIDTVLGSRSKGSAVLLTLTERKTRKEHILKMHQRTSECVNLAIQTLKQMYGSLFPSLFKTITADNGSEFSELSKALEANQAVYYTHPYTSCERGTNERHNGLIRRFIPKGKSLDDIDEKQIAYVENWCNTLPRKILGYRSPQKVFLDELIQIA